MNRSAAYQINGQPTSSKAFYAMACDPSRSIAVEACAGAGKTWMLVARIVRALLDGTPAQDILAITFTKKAAGEMRERLATELRRCARLDEQSRIELLQSWGMDAEQAQRRAPELLNLHERLEAQGRQVQVRTFHSWFAALLRGAPLSVLSSLELPLAYELLENDQRAVQQVWPRFYAALVGDAERQQDFFDAVAEHGRHQTLEALRKALSKRVEFALADAHGLIETSVRSFEQVFPQLAGLERPEHALLQPLVRERWLDRAKRLGSETKKTPQKAAQAVIEAFELPDEPACMTQRLAVLRKGFLVASEDRLTTHLLKFDAALEAEPELQELLGAQRQQRAQAHHLRLARLTRVLIACYGALKRERGWVDMNDLETAAQRLLGDAELSGWMQQRMDARVRQLLIDEFQDTNPLQWQALYGWLSAYAGSGSGEAPGVFLVGDPKQSIYRFRRAEPQVFKAAQAFVVDGLSGILLSCDHTRRCASGVIEAMNTAMLAAQDAGDYQDFRAHTTEIQDLGAVEALQAIPRDAAALDQGIDDEGWRDSLTTPRVQPEEDSLAAREAQQAARWIAHRLAEGALEPKDIMVLARKRDRLVAMHEALQALGIPSEQPEKTELVDVPAVLDVLALLDVLASPGHDLSLARALKSPLFGWPDETLTQLATRVQQQRRPARVDVAGDADNATAMKAAWWDVLQAIQEAGEGGDEVMRATAERLALYRSWVVQMPPHDALSAIYEHAEVLTRFARCANAEKRATVIAALQDLLAQSLAQEGGRFLSMYRFVRSLKAGGIPRSPVPQLKAVRLLTIHGAKGLEAPVVLMLDTDSAPPRPETMGVLIDWPGEAPAPLRFVFLVSEKTPPRCVETLLLAEQSARALEELNALYVALTRARSNLVLSSVVPRGQNATSSWWQRVQPMCVQLPAPADVEGLSVTDAQAFELRALPALDPSLLVTSPEPGSQNVDEQSDIATRIGLALHRLLQWHPTAPAGFEWTAVHEQAVAREFGLTIEQARQALEMAQRTISGPAAWVWDAEQLDHWGNEVELLVEGRLLRLDRLVRERATGDWWVLDFKSREHPERDAGLLAQMHGYRTAMALAQPGETVRLAFINPMGLLIDVTSLMPSE